MTKVWRIATFTQSALQLILKILTRYKPARLSFNCQPSSAVKANLGTAVLTHHHLTSMYSISIITTNFAQDIKYGQSLMTSMVSYSDRFDKAPLINSQFGWIPTLCSVSFSLSGISSDAFSHGEKLLDFSEGQGHLCSACGRHGMTWRRSNSTLPGLCTRIIGRVQGSSTCLKVS